VAFTAASFVLERWLRAKARSALLDSQSEMNQPEADPVAEAEAVLAEPVAEEPVLVVAQPDPEPEPAKEEQESMADPSPLPALTDIDGRMATHVVAEWKARGELDRLWEMVDSLSQRDLADRLHLRSRNQGVRLKALRAEAA
jgi:hypothetical protein